MWPSFSFPCSSLQLKNFYVTSNNRLKPEPIRMMVLLLFCSVVESEQSFKTLWNRFSKATLKTGHYFNLPNVIACLSESASSWKCCFISQSRKTVANALNHDLLAKFSCCVSQGAYCFSKGLCNLRWWIILQLLNTFALHDYTQIILRIPD